MSRETDQEFSKFQADAEQNEAEAEREALAKKQKADEETLKKYVCFERLFKGHEEDLEECRKIIVMNAVANLDPCGQVSGAFAFGVNSAFAQIQSILGIVDRIRKGV